MAEKKKAAKSAKKKVKTLKKKVGDADKIKGGRQWSTSKPGGS